MAHEGVALADTASVLNKATSTVTGAHILLLVAMAPSTGTRQGSSGGSLGGGKKWEDWGQFWQGAMV